MSTMWHAGKFSLLTGHDPNAVVEFWEHALTQRWGMEHPALADNRDALHCMLPIMTHVDGAE
eukprot:5784388-Alexandrium_andersonii.AAC.1